MKPKIFVAYINLLAWLFNLAYGLTCYSCFLACTSPENCDCTSGTCSGPYCYSRLTSYNGNAHFGLHKGCASQFHGPTGTDCVSDTIDNTADCICNSTDLCNGVELIKTAKNFQLQECCEKTHEDTELCPKTCTGSYCYDDQFTGEKGCGATRSEMLRNLRIFDLNSVPGKRVCGKLWFDETSQILHQGCVCMGPKCNSINLEQTPPSYSRAKHQCNSCQSHKDLTTGESLNTCQKNNSCWGNLCFVHLKAEQFVQFYDDEYDEPGPPVKEDSQNLQFGCVLTDQPQSVQIGCNIEWTSGEISVDGDNKISLIECICDSKFCNHKDLLSIKFDRTPLLTTTPAAISVASDAQLTTAKTNLIVPVKTSGAFPHRTPFVSLIFWVVFILLVKRQE